MQPMTQRPANLAWPYLNPNHPLYQGLVFAGLGPHPGGFTCHDCSPYGNHGTLTNMDPATDWVWDSTLNRWALDFDGSDDYTDLGFKAALDNQPLFSFAVWVKTADTGGGIFGQGDWNNGPGWGIGLYVSKATVQVAGASPTPYRERRTTYNVNTNTWWHLCGTWITATNELILYVNGISGGTLSSGGTVASYTAPAFTAAVGRFAFTSQSYVAGKMCDAMAWQRVLSAQEASQLADPSNVMLSGLILPPRRRLWAVTAAPAVARKRQLIGGGICA